MRVSEYYNLNLTQPSLDFVDVDIVGDTKIFVDPRAIRLLINPWAEECVYTIQNFFQTVLDAIHEQNNLKALRLLGVLHEPNETHLGLSKGKSKGKAFGKKSSENVWISLSKSEAVKSGLIEDLEDTILMIEGVSNDRISDMATNIIRGLLIDYTQNIAEYYGIPLFDNISSGPIWNTDVSNWETKFVSLPLINNKKLLLVPKAIVRRKMEYSVDEYYTHFILEHLRGIEMSANSELVELLKNGKKRVQSKLLKAKYGTGKESVVRITKLYPEILDLYREEKRYKIRAPLTHYDISTVEGTPPPDWDSLLNNVLQNEPGNTDSHKYEKAIEAFFTTLFYPSLTNPIIQTKLHQGRKRVDITYSNIARKGFFYWLALNYSSANIFVECKNYTGEIGNPELDQISGRFSPSRGQVGIIVCRNFDDKQLFLKRCKDTALDQRGFILVLDDADLRELINDKHNDPETLAFQSLQAQFTELIF